MAVVERCPPPFGIIVKLKRLSEQMTAYVHGSPIDSDTLSICKISGTHGRLDLSFGFPSEFSVLSLPKHKIYFQLRHVIKTDSSEIPISVVISSLR